MATRNLPTTSNIAPSHGNNNASRLENELLRLEISAEKISCLLSTHLICAADLHCLDNRSQQCLKKLCLKNCLAQPAFPNTEIQHATTP